MMEIIAIRSPAALHWINHQNVMKPSAELSDSLSHSSGQGEAHREPSRFCQMNQHMPELPGVESKRLRGRILAVTTASYVGCFAVWTIFAIIGVEIQREYD